MARYIEDDPLNAARGIMRAILYSVIFWLIIAAIVWAVMRYQ